MLKLVCCQSLDNTSFDTPSKDSMGCRKWRVFVESIDEDVVENVDFNHAKRNKQRESKRRSTHLSPFAEEFMMMRNS